MFRKYTAQYASMSPDQLRRLCVLLAGAVPHDDTVKEKILAALITLRKKIEATEFRETLRAVDDVNLRMKKIGNGD